MSETTSSPQEGSRARQLTEKGLGGDHRFAIQESPETKWPRQSAEGGTTSDTSRLFKTEEGFSGVYEPKDIGKESDDAPEAPQN